MAALAAQLPMEEGVMARIAKKVVAQLAAAKASELIDIPAGGIVLPENKPTAWQLVRERGDMLVEPGVNLDLEPGTPVFSYRSTRPQFAHPRAGRSGGEGLF